MEKLKLHAIFMDVLFLTHHFHRSPYCKTNYEMILADIMFLMHTVIEHSIVYFEIRT